jgi:hypothetical protein
MKLSREIFALVSTMVSVLTDTSLEYLENPRYVNDILLQVTLTGKTL